MASLLTGGNAPLLESSVDVLLEWSEWEGRPQDIDLCAFLLGANGKVRDDTDFVFYNQPVHPSGAVRHTGRDGTTERMHLDVGLLADAVQRVAFVAATSGTFGEVKTLSLTVADPNGANDELRFDITGASSETAFVMAELGRFGEQWIFTTGGQGRDAGLAGAARQYGVNIGAPDEAEPGAPAEPAEPVAVEPPVDEPMAVEEPTSPPDSPAPVSITVLPVAPSDLNRPRLLYAKVGPGTPNLDGQPLALAVGQSIALVKSGQAPQTLWLRITHTADSVAGADVAVIPYDEHGDPGAAVSFDMDGAGGQVRLVSKPTSANPENTAAIELSLLSAGRETAGLTVVASSWAGARLDALRSFVIDLVAPDGALFARSEIPAPTSTGVVLAVIKRDAAGNWVFTPAGTEAPGRTASSLIGAGRWALSA